MRAAQAAADAIRVVEGVVGAALVLLAVVLAGAWCLRRWRVRHSERVATPGVPALARVGGPVVNPEIFGGGHPAARSVRRRDTVVHGYLAVVEEYVGDDDLTRWCTVSVQLPGGVPDLVVDHRSAPDAPLASLSVGVPGFDDTYAVDASEPSALLRVLAPSVRSLLVDEPVQRFRLRGRSVQLRSFDADRVTADVQQRLVGLAEAILSSAPSFVSLPGEPVGAVSAEPLRPGLYGRDPEPGLA